MSDASGERVGFFGGEEILQAICKLKGQPVGLNTISIIVSEDDETVADVYEPFLIQMGLILKTPRGRVATQAAYELCQLPIPDLGVHDET